MNSAKILKYLWLENYLKMKIWQQYFKLKQVWVGNLGKLLLLLLNQPSFLVFSPPSDILFASLHCHAHSLFLFLKIKAISKTYIVLLPTVFDTKSVKRALKDLILQCFSIWVALWCTDDWWSSLSSHSCQGWLQPSTLAQNYFFFKVKFH